jgi:hypothetical protein
MLSTVHWARSASRLKAHCRQQGPFSIPEHLRVAGFLPQIEQWYIPGWLSITSNNTGDFGMAASQSFRACANYGPEISDSDHISMKKPRLEDQGSGGLRFEYSGR